MQGASRAAAAASRDAFRTALAGGADRKALADELYAVIDVLDGNATLRRALVDPSREPSERAELVGRLFGGKIGQPTEQVLRAAAQQRWSGERDLADALEGFAVESVIASAEVNGRADRVSDELFRFERIVAANPDLRTAITDTSAPADKRAALVDQLVGGKVSDEAAYLAHKSVTASRGRRFDRTITEYLDTAARRRDQQTATVTTAVPIGEAERERLAEGLSRVYGGKVRVNAVLDPRVMGGVKVEIGDEVIDGSILRKLEGARRAMGA